MAMRRNLEGRNGEIWRHYCRGMIQEDIAEQFGISQPRVSEIVTEVAGSISPDEREQWRVQAIEVLREAHLAVTEKLYAKPPPAFHAGAILMDENDEIVRDEGGFYTALHALVKVHERMARTLGTDAPVQLETAAELRVTVEGVDLEALK